MKENKQEQKKDMMLGLLNKNKNDKILFSPIVEESKAKELPKVEEKPKEVISKKQEEVKTCKKTYNIPVDIVEDMKKVVYMDRDLKGQTDLLVKALRKYLSSKDVKELLEEYDNLKKK